MATTSWKFCATAAQEAGGGTKQWSSDALGGVALVGTEVSADDNVFAYGEWTSLATTYWLKCTMGSNAFTSSDVPSGATIDGIEVRVRRYRGTGTISSSDVKTVKGGTIGGNDLESGTDWATTEETVTYGGATELWGQTWTQTDVIASTFGAAIQVVYASSMIGPSTSAFVDSVEIRVHYTAAGGGSTKRKRNGILIAGGFFIYGKPNKVNQRASRRATRTSGSVHHRVQTTVHKARVCAMPVKAGHNNRSATPYRTAVRSDSRRIETGRCGNSRRRR